MRQIFVNEKFFDPWKNFKEGGQARFSADEIFLLHSTPVDHLFFGHNIVLFVDNSCYDFTHAMTNWCYFCNVKIFICFHFYSHIWFTSDVENVKKKISLDAQCQSLATISRHMLFITPYRLQLSVANHALMPFHFTVLLIELLWLFYRNFYIYNC